MYVPVINTKPNNMATFIVYTTTKQRLDMFSKLQFNRAVLEITLTLETLMVSSFKTCSIEADTEIV